MRTEPARYGGSNSFVTVSISRLSEFANVDLMRFTCKSSMQMPTNILGAHSDCPSVDIGAAAPEVKAAKLRSFAVQADRRSPAVPAAPMMADAGLESLDVAARFGLFTPLTIVSRIDREVSGILVSADVRSHAAKVGFEVFPSSRLMLEDYIESKIALWRLLTRDATFQPE